MKTEDWKTEANVMAALGKLGIRRNISPSLTISIWCGKNWRTFAPDVLFNLVEQFKNNPGFDQNIVSFFEMQGVPFTGCGSTGLTLCKHKGISKKILQLSRHPRAELRCHSRAANASHGPSSSNFQSW